MNKSIAVVYALLFCVLFFLVKPAEVVLMALWDARFYSMSFFIASVKERWYSKNSTTWEEGVSFVKEMWRK